MSVPPPDSLAATLFGIAVLGILALMGGGIWFLRRRRDTTKGVLMLVCAVVLAANVAIWSF